jgi:flagellar basal body-associated protein FliL
MSQKGIAPLLLILGLTVVLIVSASISFINFKKSAAPEPSTAASAAPEAPPGCTPRRGGRQA